MHLSFLNQSWTILCATTIDIQLVCPQETFVKDLAIEWSVAETGGTNSVTPIPAPLFCDIEFWVNGGSKLLQTLYGEQIWFNTGMTLNTKQLTYVSAVGNYNTSFASPSSIAASGTAKYFVPLIGNWIAQRHGIDLSKINGNILVRIKTKNSVASGTGTLALSNVRLIMETEEMPHDNRQEIKDHFASNIIEGSFLDCVNQREASQTYTAGQSYTKTLTSVNNYDVPFIIACLRSWVQEILKWSL